MSLIDRLPLRESDYEKFERKGIPRSMVDNQDIFRVDHHEGARMVGKSHVANDWHRYSGIVYPIRWPGDDTILDYVLRRDEPDQEMKPDGEIKETGKYMLPPGARNLAYMLRDVDPAWLDDVTIPAVIVEGAAKCLALWVLACYGLKQGERPRFLPIALPGVWNWRKKDKSSGRVVITWIDDLNKIKWAGRKVTILFDSNVHWNEGVKSARILLAYMLQEWDADVFFADLPNDPAINGIDDYLEANGPIKALAIVEKAYKATWPECRESQEYFALMNWAQMDDIAGLLFARWQLSPESVQLFRAINSTWGGRKTKEFRLSHEAAYKRMMSLPDDADLSDKRKARRFVRERLEIFEAETSRKLSIKLIEVVQKGGKYDAEKEIRLNTLYRVAHKPFLDARRLANKILQVGKHEDEQVKSPGRAREIAAQVVGDYYMLANAKEEVKAEREAELRQRAESRKKAAAKDSTALKTDMLKYIGKKAEEYYQTLYAEDLAHIQIPPLMDDLAREMERVIKETCKKKPRRIKRQVQWMQGLVDDDDEGVGTLQRTHYFQNETQANPTHSDAVNGGSDVNVCSTSSHYKQHADIADLSPSDTDAEREVRPGRALWTNADFDEWVTVKTEAGIGADGRRYVWIEESETAIPFDEVFYAPSEPTQVELTPELIAEAFDTQAKTMREAVEAALPVVEDLPEDFEQTAVRF